ncbi:SDR family NAD(P)-dependent oxidoreductase [Crassaminicella profunda]|uniref:SDR family NAD(P)-dependent oxidoreductase n=1 Tax=Crassaminicella profunda TaxID=1286698 RepID=UPI001CA6BF3C|nr:SDR family oxidoreductase [Crassaminicella profunda]QZY54350.1 SDR family oxidoreductase [Crassaminicella profunda]
MLDYKKIFSLEGERALITGGATGLGFAMAECFIQAGAEVIIVGRNEEKLKEACKKLGKKANYRQFDVTHTTKANTLVEEITKNIGEITILVNNAGVHVKKPIENMTDEDFTQTLNVHVVGAFALTRAVVPFMKKSKKGSILFTASMTSILGQPFVVSYAAAKSAYLGMVRSLATEISPDGIRVNAIAPGWIETPMLHKALDGDDVRKNKILGRTPMDKFGDPTDIGWAAAYLCSPAAKFVNGVLLPVDGGASIGF